MRIILDTSALGSRKALEALEASTAQAILPAVAYTERARQWTKAGRALDGLDRILAAVAIHIEAFGEAQARAFAVGLHDNKAWDRLARDAMIAGHAGPEDVIWTSDVTDFIDVGVPKRQVVAV